MCDHTETAPEVAGLQSQGLPPWPHTADVTSGAPYAEITNNLLAKADAGARLFFALYYYPKAKELILSDYWTVGLGKAYQACCDAYLGSPKQ